MPSLEQATTWNSIWNGKPKLFHFVLFNLTNSFSNAMSTWKPTVTPVNHIQSPNMPVYTKTSLEKNPQASNPIGSGHNSLAKPFAGSPVAGQGPQLVHKQYNSPVNLYSEKNIEQTLSAHTQLLNTGATG